MIKALFFLLIFILISGFSSDSDWKREFMESIKIEGTPWLYLCSSELDAVNPFEGIGPYGAHNLFDNDKSTAWVEGVPGYGEGEYLLIGLGSSLPEKVEFENGYQKSESLYLRNSRVKSAKISLFAGFYIEGDLTEITSIYHMKQVGEEYGVLFEDKMGRQEISLPDNRWSFFETRIDLTKEFNSDFSEQISTALKYCPNCPEIVKFSYFMRFEIIDTYHGSSWDDTCISGIFPIGENSDPINSRESVVEVYESDGDGIILVDTDIRKGIEMLNIEDITEYRELDNDTEMWITLMDVSPDKEWAQVDFMFSAEERRVEEYSVLYHIRTCQRVGTDILETMYGMFGFIEEDGKVWLDTVDGPVDLEMILEKLDTEY